MNREAPSQVVKQLKRTTNFLAERLESEAAYSELIAALELLVERLNPTCKPMIKIVSPSRVLAAKLQRFGGTNELLQSYQLEVSSPISQIRQIWQHCDMMCLLYDSSQTVLGHHQKLIELAFAMEIRVLLLVNRGNASYSYREWLAAQDKLIESIELIFDDFFDLDNPEQVFYWRSQVNFLPSVRDNHPNRIKQVAKQEIRHFFDRQIVHSRQEIRKIRNDYLGGEHLFSFRQQLRQKIGDRNQYRQQLIREIKQAVHHAKADLINPFARNSWLLELQQLIDSARVKTVKKSEHIYLYLVLSDLPDAPLLQDYVWQLCQERATEILSQEWSKIIQVYGSGGLSILLAQTTSCLADLAPLLDRQEFVLTIEQQPSLDFSEIADPEALEFNSRIIFDYNYLQGSWFRLLVLVAVGLGIYLFTLVFFGAGRYFGFLIIVFQIINLITGQNIKNSKLKQHQKELKRTVAQKHHQLARITIERVNQALIQAIDSQVRQEQLQWSEAIAIAQSKLDALQQTSDRHKNKIERLQQERAIVQPWFD